MATRSAFETTRWSLILAAADHQNPESRQALAELCQTYWYPVFNFFRGRGLDDPTARDVTQEFFTTLLEKGSLGAADPERGRFRSFLLACARNFLANWRARKRAEKRGGSSRTIGLDTLESRLRAPAAGRTSDPGRMFEKQWALTLLKTVMTRLEHEQKKAGSLDRFQLLRGYLTEANRGIRFREAADQLGTTPQAVKTAVYRLRKRFADLLRAEVGQTVSQPQDVDGEIRFLLEALGD